jgi:glycosyltransferase involved in cell wall biosynthesis
MRGGERCLEVVCELYPEADLFTLLHVPGSVSPLIEGRRIVTSFIQRLPGAARRYRHYLPLFPAAVGRFDFSGYDLVISLSHCVAKGARPRPGALHLCYCFTPMRYVWDRYDDYFGRGAAWPVRLGMRPIAVALRRWDRASSRRVHHFMAISAFVADRIARCYGRAAEVVHPPVEVQRFTLAEEPGRYFLVVSALVPYKRVDLAVRAATRLRTPLVIVGSGPEEGRLRALAGPTVRFAGWRPDVEVADLYRGCKALVFPGVEDFGIAPLEALASGRPVIAYGQGGVQETMVPLNGGEGPPTALLFERQTEEALADAMVRFEDVKSVFEPKALRARAERFNRPLFKERWRERIAAHLSAGEGRC